jgi:phosphohistidine phosphatase
MNKYLSLMRHAKAVKHLSSAGRDYDRELQERGVRQASLTGAFLAAQDAPRPEWIVCSPATRTRQTADLVARGLELPAERILEDSALYLGSIDDWLAALRALSPEVAHVLAVGHNPTISELLHYLLGTQNPEEMKTSEVYQLRFAEAFSWESLGPAQGARAHAYRPEV